MGKKKKLKFEHLSSYLNFGLQFLHQDKSYMLFGLELPHDQNPLWITGFNNIESDKGESELINIHPEGCLPVLRPFSDLHKEEFKMDTWRKEAILFLIETSNLPYNSRKEHIGGIMFGDMLKLLEWHFDIYGLIKDGLAIDINTLK